MTPGNISIHIIPPGPLAMDAGWPLLSPAERVRAASFVFPKHATHWISCRAALRRILGDILHIPPGEVPLVITDLGKPELADPFDYLRFSLSHCENMALLALCVDGPVGVDLESSGRAAELPECETTFCHPAEIASLPEDLKSRGECLLELWTIKEALLKALGTGFTHDPDDVRIHRGSGDTFTATSGIPLPGIEEQIIHRLNHPQLAGYHAAVSAPVSANRIEIHSFETSTFRNSPVITGARSANPDG